MDGINLSHLGPHQPLAPAVLAGADPGERARHAYHSALGGGLAVLPVPSPGSWPTDLAGASRALHDLPTPVTTAAVWTPLSRLVQGRPALQALQALLQVQPLLP